MRKQSCTNGLSNNAAILMQALEDDYGRGSEFSLRADWLKMVGLEAVELLDAMAELESEKMVLRNKNEDGAVTLTIAMDDYVSVERQDNVIPLESVKERSMALS